MSKTYLPKNLQSLQKPGIHLVCDEVNNYALRTISCFQLLDINHFTYPRSWSQYDIHKQISKKFMLPQHSFVRDDIITTEAFPKIVCYTTKRIERDKHRFTIKKTIEKYKSALECGKKVTLILCLSEDLIYNENLYLSRRPLIEEDFISNYRYNYHDFLYPEIEQWLKKNFGIIFHLNDSKNIYLQIINSLQKSCGFKSYKKLQIMLSEIVNQPYSPIWQFLQQIFTDKRGINLEIDALNLGSKLKLIFDLNINYKNFATQFKNELIDNFRILSERKRKQFCKENFKANYNKGKLLREELEIKLAPNIILKYHGDILGFVK